MLCFIRSQRVRHDWVTKLNWTEWLMILSIFSYPVLAIFRERNVYSNSWLFFELFALWLLAWKSCLYTRSVQFSQFSRSVMSDSLWPYEAQHARPPCPSPTPRVHANPCPLSRWGHPTSSFSVIPFSSCLQSFPASGSFLMSQLFPSGGHSIGASASASVLPMNIQDWFPLFTGSIYCTLFLLDSFDFAHGCICIRISVQFSLVLSRIRLFATP